jgi:hypothetical protein
MFLTPFAEKAAPDLRKSTSKPRRSSRPDLTICLEALYDHLPLRLILPEIPEEIFLL